MKKLIIVISLFAIAACSSAPKEEETSPEQSASEAVATPAPETTTPDAAPTEPEAAPADQSMNADSGTNMEGGFPDIEGTERSGATCKNGGDERMVSVIDSREGPCGVVYTKSGNKRTVAYAKFDMSFCDKVYDNIVGNLTNGGFDCGGAKATAQPAAPAETEEAPAAEPAKEEAPAEDAGE